MSERAWSLLTFALIVAALVVGLAIRADGIAKTIPTRTYERPLGDDSFYYFALGRNLAAGNGFRVDALHPTTGFQPLWGVLIALPYLLAPAQAIQGAQGLGIVVGLVGFALIFALTRRLTGSPLLASISAGLWWLLPSTVTATLSGMETILATTAALGVFVALDWLNDRPDGRRAWVFGVALGLAVLSRVDLGVLAGVAVLLNALAPSPFAVSASLRLPPNEKPSARFASGRGEKVIWEQARRALFTRTLPVAVLVLLPWLALTVALGKPPLPESGLAVRALIGYFYPTDPSVLAPGYQLSLFAAQIAGQFYLTDGLRLLFPAISAELFALAALIVGALASFRDRRSRLLLAVVALWWIGVALAYAVGVRAFWYFDRYALPAAQVGAVVLIACLGRAAQRSRWPRLTTAALVVTLTLAAVVGANGYRVGRYDWLSGNPPPDEGLYRTAQWLNAHLSSGTRVGVFQSGLIGYYATVPVINLDGKVNGAARAALASRTMLDYVCSEGIAYVADWPSMIDQLLKARSADWREDALTLVTRIDVVSPSISPIEIDKVNCKK